MIQRVTIKNFKRFSEQSFDLADSVVLAGPNNAGKSTLLQAIATWKLGIDRWDARRTGGVARQRSGVAITRNDFTTVPLREMNLLWEDRRVTGPKGMSGSRRMIEIIVEGKADGESWTCGIELQYDSPEQAYARPLDAKNLSGDAIRNFPPDAARNLTIVHVPPLSGIERDEPRRERGMQDLLIGQGRPGDILRNLLLDISSETQGRGRWDEFKGHVSDLFQIDLSKPSHSPAQPYIVCEYRERGHSRPLDLSNAGSGTLQVILLFAFLYARPAAVILLDEPDAHQHVILQGQVYDRVRRVARERGGQVIVATHSEVILDATEPQRVIGFMGTPRRLASEVERDQLREALKRVTTTELLLGQEVGSVLYVESETDEKILGEWARILDHPAQRFFKRPYVHWLRGRSLRAARDHFFAMRALMPDIPAVCLLDGDNRDEPESNVEQFGLKVLRWRRYEIENYLLQPEAIKRFVKSPLFDQHIDAEFGKRVPAGTDLFGDHAELKLKKASDEFLPRIFEGLATDTPKRDLYQLAAVMEESEIHPEVREKLDQIAEAFRLDAPKE